VTERDSCMFCGRPAKGRRGEATPAARAREGRDVGAPREAGCVLLRRP
jgi:hypothetical protein